MGKIGALRATAAKCRCGGADPVVQSSQPLHFTVRVNSLWRRSGAPVRGTPAAHTPKLHLRYGKAPLGIMGKGEQTIERLLDVAEAAVLPKGFGATSIEEVIAEAGITKSGLFLSLLGQEQARPRSAETLSRPRRSDPR